MSTLPENQLTHHAYLIEGDPPLDLEALSSAIEWQFEMERRGNPDFHHTLYEKFAISDARTLVARACVRPFTSDTQLFVIGVGSITREAQNALLKLCEEPLTGTHLFFMLHNPDALLGTLRSRMGRLPEGVYTRARKARSDSDALVEKFLLSDCASREKLLAGIISAGEVSEAQRFLSALERVLYTEGTRGGVAAWSADRRRLFTLFQESRRNLATRAPSLAMVLEQLIGAVPRSATPRKGLPSTP
jgi:hypothetical protein